MLRYQHVHLEGFGYALPPNVISSAELEQQLASIYERFGLHVGRLELMTGIRERRFWEPGTLPSDGSVLAGRRALEQSGMTGDQIECVIHGAVSRDFLEPATASVVHEKLSINPKSIMYDVSNACLGFVNGMISLGNMIELSQVKRGLVVAAESSRQLVQSTIDHLLSRAGELTRQELKSAFASLTIGSGAVALVLTHESVSQTEHRFIGGAVRCATQHHELCRGSENTGFAKDTSMLMATDSEELLVQGCSLAQETWADFQANLGWSHEQIQRTFCHQVGLAHRDRLYDTLRLDTAKDFSTFEVLGNVGSVSLPLTMAMGLERTPPCNHERIAMLGIGSGLSCVMLGVEW